MFFKPVADFCLHVWQIGFPTTLVFENHDQNGRIFNQTLPMDDGSPSTMSSAMQTPVSNQNMVELGKKLLQAASENDVENVRLLMTGGAPFTGNWVCKGNIV